MRLRQFSGVAVYKQKRGHWGAEGLSMHGYTKPLLALIFCGVVSGASASPVPFFGHSERIQRDTLTGFAMEGFDPVAYFLTGQVQAGSATHETIWNGAAWRFASAANKAAFEEAPHIYAPQFGGYDALMVASGLPVESNAQYFLIQNGKLYLFRSKENLLAFKSQSERLTLAHTRWSDVEKMLNAL
jgi:YHS domain-containing protein